MKRTYGWRPDKPDMRDLTFSSLRMRAVKLPSSVDLRPKCPPVVDQGELGSCTSNALTGAYDFIQKFYLKNPFLAPQEYGKDFAASSRLFIYYNERVLEGTVHEDAGAEIRDGIKTLAKEGSVEEEKWPYVVSRFDIKPPPVVYKAAKKHCITNYYRVNNLLELRTALAAGFPVTFGFAVYESFESSKVAKTGMVPMPGPGEDMEGGHAVLAVGYDDKAKRILVRNSWGTSWGMKGYFTLPYDYVSNKNLSDDFWVIKL